ncbi:MAG: transposase domain-containing protein [Lentisphaeria bacterium]|jgi:hypothetical protein
MLARARNALDRNEVLPKSAIGAAPYEYLADVLARIQGHPASRGAELLPHRLARRQDR